MAIVLWRFFKGLLGSVIIDPMSIFSLCTFSTPIMGAVKLLFFGPKKPRNSVCPLARVIRSHCLYVGRILWYASASCCEISVSKFRL